MKIVLFRLVEVNPRRYAVSTPIFDSEEAMREWTKANPLQAGEYFVCDLISRYVQETDEEKKERTRRFIRGTPSVKEWPDLKSPLPVS